MNIFVIGAGAIGSLIGALLARAGQEVVLVGRADQVAEIRRRGLVVQSATESFCIHLAAEEHLDEADRNAGPPDLYLLAVKTQDVPLAARALAARREQAPVVTMQNGVCADQMAATFLDRGRIVGCVILVHATYLIPGLVERGDGGAMVIGYPFKGNDEALGEVATTLSTALPTTITRDILGARWTKLILNLINPLPAITGLSQQELLGLPEMPQLALLLRREGIAVTAKAGIGFAPIPGASGNFELARLDSLPEAARIFAGKLLSTSGKQPALGSTLQSIKRGKMTEIDYLNGEIVRLARQLGMPAPYNDLAVRLVHQVERTGKFISPSVLWRQAQAAVQLDT